jgi:hypothetical protein
MEMRIERKPTSHSTPCKFCNKEIIKGDYRVIIRSLGYHKQDSVYIHPRCLGEWMEKEMIYLRASKENKENLNINPSRRN